MAFWSYDWKALTLVQKKKGEPDTPPEPEPEPPAPEPAKADDIDDWMSFGKKDKKKKKGKVCDESRCFINIGDRSKYTPANRVVETPFRSCERSGAWLPQA